MINLHELTTRPHCWLGGVAEDTPSFLPMTNPATKEDTGTAGASSAEQVSRAVYLARRAFDTGPWPRMTATERAEVLTRLHSFYTASQAYMADLITLQNGSPVSFTAQTQHPREILYRTVEMAWEWDSYERDGAWVTHDPVGVVAIVTPWNMPQKTILMKLAPALLAGCTVVIKPAPETPWDALLLARLCREAGVPDGVVSVVPGGPVTGEQLVTHALVDKIAFTGSTTTGRRIATQAGSEIKRCSLELGGKSATLLAEDADLDAWAAGLLGWSFLLTGQICSNQTRIIYPRKLHEAVLDRAVAVAASLKVGHPHDPATQIGPLVSERAFHKVAQYMAMAKVDGILYGGQCRDDLGGWYVAPGVVDNLPTTHPIFWEEVFGPLISLHPYDGDWGEGIRLANASTYGLAAGVWTRSPDLAEDAARWLRVGTVHINGGQTTTAHPLGGFKQSGIGRELGPEGLTHYMEIKVIAR